MAWHGIYKTIYKSIECVVFWMAHPNRCAPDADWCTFSIFLQAMCPNWGSNRQIIFFTFSTGIIHPCETSNSFDPYPGSTGQFRANDEEDVSLGDFELPARDMTVTAQNSISYKDFVGPKRSKWLIQSPSYATMCKIWDSQRHPKTMISLH